MAEKNGYKIMLAGILAAILLMQSIAILPTNAQEVEIEASPGILDPATWYITSAGNLGTDRYTLYPYDSASLKIGFSRFGEMINSIDNVGLEYKTEDAFAPPAGSGVPATIQKKSWLEGWLINITYNHNVHGIRNVWAMAQHGDITDFQGRWIQVDDSYPGSVGANGPVSALDIEANEDPRDAGHYIDPVNPAIIDTTATYQGGRKTNGTAVTGPIEILYDGPRRFIARTNTTVYDFIDTTTPPSIHALVHVIFTIDFNKSTKEVNIIKDVKIAEQTKFTLAPLDIYLPNLSIEELPDRGKYNFIERFPLRQERVMAVSFSNRGEFDIEQAGGFRSFVHYYTYAASHTNDPDNDVLPTVYNNNYALLRTMPPLVSINAATNEPLSIWGSEPPAMLPKPDGTTDATYDVAQVISSIDNSEGNFVAWAAFWPSTSDWDSDGGNDQQWWQSLEEDDFHYIDGLTPEPFQSPYVIGEWDFFLAQEAIYFNPDAMIGGNEIDGDELEADIQFRGVTQYGLTDRHTELVSDNNPELSDFPILNCITQDGTIAGNVAYGGAYDADSTPNWNILDPEVAYYLSAKFCPWDLRDAHNKETQRHLIVIPDDAPGNWSVSSVDLGVDFSDFVGTDTDSSNVIGDTTAEAEEWRAYSTFAERILADGVLLQRGVNYTIQNIDDNAVVFFTQSISGDDELDIYFSTSNAGSYEWIAVGRDSAVIDSAAAASVVDAFAWGSPSHPAVLWSALDMQDTTHPTAQFLMAKFGTGDTRGAYHYNHPTDHRSALKMFWSTTIPIASSNIITVGGPGANLVTEYFNEFMPAVYRGQFFGVPDLLIVSGWDAAGSEREKPPLIQAHSLSDLDRTNNIQQTKYNITHPSIVPPSTQTRGWAVVSTYKDINGTVGYAVWGATGNDSFWIAQALNNGLEEVLAYKQSPLTIEKIIREMGGDGPSSNDPLTSIDISMPLATWLAMSEEVGITTIVVVIDYTDNTSKDGGFHPRLTIVEELGIISEIPQHPDP